MAEYWDLYDRDRKPLGLTMKRGRDGVRPEGAYNTVVAVLTVSEDGRILITRRSHTKNAYPGWWEFTCGAVVAGENSRDAAYRELYEETGLKPETVTLLGTLTELTAFCDIYLARMSRAADQTVILQPGETDEYAWVTPSDFERMAAATLLPGPCIMRYYTVRHCLRDVLDSRLFEPSSADVRFLPVDVTVYAAARRPVETPITPIEEKI